MINHLLFITAEVRFNDSSLTCIFFEKYLCSKFLGISIYEDKQNNSKNLFNQQLKFEDAENHLTVLIMNTVQNVIDCLIQQKYPINLSCIYHTSFDGTLAIICLLKIDGWEFFISILLIANIMFF